MFTYLILLKQVIIINYKVLNNNWLGNYKGTMYFWMQGAQQGEMICLLIDEGERGLPHRAGYIAI